MFFLYNANSFVSFKVSSAVEWKESFQQLTLEWIKTNLDVINFYGIAMSTESPIEPLTRAGIKLNPSNKNNPVGYSGTQKEWMENFWSSLGKLTIRRKVSDTGGTK